MKRLFETKDDYTGLLLRLTITLVLFPHGAQKLLGWFGGYGFTVTMHFLPTQKGCPGSWASWLL